jgi:hypothetical protein
MGRVEVVEYRGVTYRRYPDSKRWADATYFTPLPKDRARGIGRLHQEVWKAAYGPIPPGYHVHHRDGDGGNNRLDNLELVHGSRHLSDHARERPVAGEQWAGVLEAARVWHGSPEGRAWHVEHGARTWANRIATDRTCQHCGATYTSRSLKGNEAFCSNACKSAARRARGDDTEQRVCVACGGTYTTNRYSRGQTCSRECRWTLRRAKT